MSDHERKRWTELQEHCAKKLLSEKYDLPMPLNLKRRPAHRKATTLNSPGSGRDRSAFPMGDRPAAQGSTALSTGEVADASGRRSSLWFRRLMIDLGVSIGDSTVSAMAVVSGVVEQRVVAVDESSAYHSSSES